MGDFPITACIRIIRRATGLRVGKDAAEAFAEYLEEVGANISREAGRYAKHAGRKTVRACDIRLATE
jgi:histone H3/H4